MYSEYQEAYKLFSNRPDIKEKHKRNYITSAPKRKRNVDDGDVISMFLMAITLFVMACTIAIV